MYVDTYNIPQSSLCTSPPGVHGLSRPYPAVVDAPCLSTLFTMWDQGPMGGTACVQYVIRDCTKRWVRWQREEWKLKWWETIFMWKRREYDTFFVLEGLARRQVLKGHAEKNVFHCLIKQGKKRTRHLRGWTDRAKVGSVIASSILEVCGASLLMPNRAHLPWMLRIPVSIAVFMTDFLRCFSCQWVKVILYAQIWYLTADHECERHTGNTTPAVTTKASGLKEISLRSPSSSVLIRSGRTTEDMGCGSLVYLPCSTMLCSTLETPMFLT